jgi:hypothetical protein
MSVFYDVFNGDADGICALLQLRLAAPRASVLVTGAKRDIALLDGFEAQAGDEITVLDISLARNAAALHKQLARGATCRYFDHHYAGEIPSHPRFTAYIETAPDGCTSLIVDRFLGGRHRAWAVVAAFGDNLTEVARAAAAPLALDAVRLAQLQELGEAINYNAYGDTVDDLHYHPADLYQTLMRYADPFDFIGGEPVFEILRAGRADDLYRASEIAPTVDGERCAIYVLPDAAWSRRVGGTFANQLAGENPARAHAVLVQCRDGYAVSVRAAAARPRGADALCRQFESGGGRERAAGIDRLAESEFTRFVEAFRTALA